MLLNSSKQNIFYVKKSWSHIYTHLYMYIHEISLQNKWVGTLEWKRRSSHWKSTLEEKFRKLLNLLIELNEAMNLISND